jgi:uroporphyrin-3 C-methyltransferase
MTEKSSKSKQPSSEQMPAKDNSPVAENSSRTEKADLKEKKKQQKKSKPKGQPLSKVAALALLLVMIISVAVGFVYFILFNQGMLTAEFSKSRASVNSRINSLERDLKNTNNALSLETQTRKDTEAKFGAFKTAMEAVATKLGRSSNEWRLAEIEYLLTIANHRLGLAHDRDTAIAIFEIADHRIKNLGDPALLKIRKSIKEELISLHAVQEPDITGMALSLGSLASEVERLPLMDKERVAVATGQIEDQAPDSWQDIPAAVWKDIKSLVVVRRHQQPTEPLLPPGESWFLYQNLQLKLEQARLALLRRDTALFRQHLKEADAWISTFFNEEASIVINALQNTSALAKVELQPATPDVSGSLRQLRSLLVERGVKIGKQ